MNAKEAQIHRDVFSLLHDASRKNCHFEKLKTLKKRKGDPSLENIIRKSRMLPKNPLSLWCDPFYKLLKIVSKSNSGSLASAGCLLDFKSNHAETTDRETFRHDLKL